MRKLGGNTGAQNSLLIRGRIIYITMVMFGIFLMVSASRVLLDGELEYQAARTEYEQLREQYPVISMYAPASQHPASLNEDIGAAALQMFGINPAPARNIPEAEDPLVGLMEMNSDFVGWIYIEDIIDYPVVRGRDNSRYLGLTFSGQYNSAGTVFMDYRHSQSFSEPVCILYGHNVKDGSMFAPLNRYTDKAYMEAKPYITIVSSEGEVLHYRIFAAKRTDAWDKDYELGITDGEAAVKSFKGVPDGTSRILLLSTCTPNNDRDERLLVYAACP